MDHLLEKVEPELLHLLFQTVLRGQLQVFFPLVLILLIVGLHPLPHLFLVHIFLEYMLYQHILIKIEHEVSVLLPNAGRYGDDDFHELTL